MGEFDAWEPEEPPRGFADRVARLAERETAERRARARRVGTTVVVAAAAAAAALVLSPFPSRGIGGAAKGDAIAKDRVEVPMADRAIAVLEPGAHVSWSAEEVTQEAGDVFYRVEPRAPGAAPLRVHTAAGDVTVKGTCFRVKVIDMNRRDVVSSAVGAAAAAMVLVGVYEGKVAVSHAKGEPQVEVAAGHAARLDGEGAHAAGDLGALEASGGAAPGAKSADDDPLLAANQNLADQVKAYKDRLAANEDEKKTLETRLKTAEQKLASQENDGAPPRNEWDLTQDDWKQLAAEGTIKSRYPCGPMGSDYKPSAEQLAQLGLAPEDGPVLTQAYEHSKQRLWDSVKTSCAQIVGSADLAARLGTDVCGSIIANSIVGEAHGKDLETVAKIRAGELPMPGPNDPADAYVRMLLAQTGEIKSFEADLAKTLGPDEAHRIAYADDLSMCSSIQSTRGPARLPPR